LTLILITSAQARAQGPDIAHSAVDCIVAGRFPKLDACFAPQDAVARARVYFRAKGGIHWYFVEMRPEGGCYTGVLPKPKLSAARVDYYIDVLDRSFAEGRTPEHGARVVEGGMECKDKMVAMGLASASILLGVPAGAPAVPFGFQAAGIVGAAGASAATTGTTSASSTGGTTSAAASGGGGGGGAVLGVLIGAGAAGGAVYYFTHKNNESTADAPTTPVAPTAPSYDGGWAGTTSQQQLFRFTVANGGVTDVDTAYLSSTRKPPGPVPIRQSFSPAPPISDGRFVIRGDGFTITGVFGSPTTASGTLEVGGSAITWQAAKQ
jgi:hypothetical protein